MNLDNKKPVWKYTMVTDRVTSPIIIGNYIYFGTKDGYLYILNRITGKVKIKEYLNGSILSRITYSNGKLYVAVRGERFSDEFTIYQIKNKL